MSRLSPPSHPLVITAALCITILLMTGCGPDIFEAVAPAIPPISTEGGMSGVVHGGNQPISGATVDLYAVGTSGYGSTGTLYATTTTDTNGKFSFELGTSSTSPIGTSTPNTNTFNCPTGSSINPNPQMYLIAHGGNTQSSGTNTNSAAALTLAIGVCEEISTLPSLNINPVSSVATMAALQQYFNPVNESFGYPNTTQAALGFSNNVSLISNMESMQYGQANTSLIRSAVPLGHGNLAGSTVSVTITPEYNKINLIANILAACVDSSTSTSTNCTTLFTNAEPPTAIFTSQPTQAFTSITSSNEDTLQALYFMMTNPTSGGALSTNTTSNGANIKNLFALAAGGAPFQPYYNTAPPTDWTIGINYASTSTCVTQSNNTTTTSTGTFLDDVISLAVDASGNVWSASNTPSNGNLFEISPQGNPLTCGLGTLSSGVTAVTIDSAGYVWTDSTTTAGSPANYYLYKWNPAGSLDSTWPTITATSGSTITDSTTQAITADGTGNVFYSLNDAGDRGIVKITGGGMAGASPSSTTSTNFSASINSRPYFMQVDSSGDIWIADKDGYFEEFYPDSNNGTGYSSLVSITDSSDPYGMAIGQIPTGSSTGTETINMAGNHSWQVFQPGSTAGTVSTTGQISVAAPVAGLNGGESLAVDGASNLWAGCTSSQDDNWVTEAANTKTTYAFCELSWSGVNISGTGTAGGGFQKDPTLIMPYGMRGVAVDPSGNVWGGQYNGTGIVELVGQGVPVVTPLSTATAKGALGAKP